jgi:hypothetical protein
LLSSRLRSVCSGCLKAALACGSKGLYSSFIFVFALCERKNENKTVKYHSAEGYDSLTHATA